MPSAGAGTPSDSAYAPWLRELCDGAFAHLAAAALRGLPGPDERPFVAALPRAALAHLEGPLAVFGHVDLAWQYSYKDAEATVPSRPSKFAALIEDACRGRRAGAIARDISRAAADAGLRLTAEIDQSRRDPSPLALRKNRIAHLWMLFHDLTGYILLGDPAVRLRRPTPAIATHGPTFAPDPALVQLAHRLGRHRLEEAMARVLVSDPPKQVAASLSIDLTEFRALEEAYRGAGRRILGFDP